MRLGVKADFRAAMFARYPAVGPLFDKVVLQGQGTDEDRHRFQHLWQAVARRELLEVPLEDQFLIQPLTITLPPLARRFATITCSRCGEGVRSPARGLKTGRWSAWPAPGKSIMSSAARGSAAAGWTFDLLVPPSLLILRRPG